MKMIVEFDKEDVLEMVGRLLKERGFEFGPLTVEYQHEGEYSDVTTVGFRIVGNIIPPPKKEE